ncbi:MAG: nicotinate-nicotinamide nucleotide adenylyltransferase [Lachnospiraceae bacterium]|nr:nicotinate-nicotinamide nucleotide adenylyltransferase [Lachnospiraceae bacterium]
MQTIVLIFGTFNPITNAHIQMGIVAKRHLPDALIIYIPSKNYFLRSWKGMKNTAIMDGDNRAALMRQALAPYGFLVDDLEITTPISGKTYDTIAVMKEKYQTDDIYILMGTDKVAELERWYRGEELIAQNRFLIICRDGQALDTSVTATVTKYSGNFTPLDNSDYSSVSSTAVRRAYIEGRLEDVRDYIPDNVYTYLDTHKEVYS